MAFSHDFDPANGFVALPSDIMDIEMTPGAFRLLVELCRMANKTGECWPSLAQLSDRIGRSRAAISGYIAELREIDLLSTINQKMANGYNYRLKYCVKFWQKWRAQLSRPEQKQVRKKPERSVQPIERRVNSKKHIHNNHTTQQTKGANDAVSSKLESLYLEWVELTQKTNFPDFKTHVPPILVTRTQRSLLKFNPVALSLQETETRLRKLWIDLKVEIQSEEIQQQSRTLVKHRVTHAGFEYLEKTLANLWQKHWRKAPSDAQFKEVLQKASASNRTEGMLKMLKQYLRRWEISQNKLHHRSHSNSLSKQHAA